MENEPIPAPDGHLATSLAALRGLAFTGPVADQQHLVPGVFFSLDPDVANTVHLDSKVGELLKVRFGVDRPGRWMSLNLGLGPVPLEKCTFAGVVCKSDAPTTTTFRICLRSGRDGGHLDAFFSKTVVSGQATSIHMDLIDLASQPAIPVMAPWRELVIFFQCVSLEIAIRDFRFIAI